MTRSSDFGRIPLSFVENRGQVDKQVRFYLHGGQGTVYFTRDAFVYELVKSRPGRVKERVAVTMNLHGAARDVRVYGDKKLSGHHNYFRGKAPDKWHPRVSLYAEIVYENVYPGIDLRIYGRGEQMEYDFIVHPGADPSQIGLEVDGADGLSIEAEGHLVIRTSLFDLRHSRPVAYQMVDGKRSPTAVGFSLEKTLVRFCTDGYDRTRDLVIDPISLTYWSYLGGSGSEEAGGIAVDAGGYIYVTGETKSLDFPLQGAYEDEYIGGDSDIFITKFSPDGTSLVYSTYLGGTEVESTEGIAVDPTGHAFVTGATNSTDFPTVNAYDDTSSGSFDAYVVKVSPSGDALVYATYLGGSTYDWLPHPTITTDAAKDIALGPDGSAYVVGVTGADDFPVFKAYQPKNASRLGGASCFVTKFSPDGKSLSFSTYLGGSYSSSCYAVAVDSAGSAYVTGYTGSSDFPTLNAFQSTYGGWFSDVFVTKFNPAGTALVYSTYLGGSSSESGQDIAVDSGGHAYVTGGTGSPEFPLVNAYQSTLKGGDAFVSKINPDGKTVAYSTFLGGAGDPDGGVWKSGSDAATAIAVDASGAATVTGQTRSPDFPLVGAYYDGRRAYAYAFVAKFAPNGTSLSYSTKLHDNYGFPTGIALDGSGNVYVCGHTKEIYPFYLPTVDTFEPNFAGGNYDTFVAKLSEEETPARELIMWVGSGGKVVSEPEGIDCRGKGLDAIGCSHFFPFESTVALTAVADSGYEFAGWGYDCEQTGPCQPLMDMFRLVSAGFTELPGAFYRLTVTKGGGGTVTSDPAGIDCGGDCTHDYFDGTAVTLTAAPETGWQFDGWSGDCSGTDPCALTMAAEKTVTAAFSKILSQWHTLTVATAGSGTVTSSPAGIDCGSSCSADFLDAAPVVLSAAPAVGWQFDGWSGDCSGTTGCHLTMNGDRSATATFSKLPYELYTLTVSATGSGTVTSSPEGIDCGSDCSQVYKENTEVTLTATPDSGWQFDGWSGDCSGTAGCQVTMGSGKTAAAAFTRKSATLTVIRNGSGTVTSQPAGIDCGIDCSEALPHGTRVTLSVLPEPGWVFGGWTGPCDILEETCELTLTQDTRVAATFLGWTYGWLVPDGGGSYDGWSYHGSCVNSDGIWLVGGARDQSAPTWETLSHVGTYNPVSDSWNTAHPSLGLGRVYLAGACTDDHVFALGGRNPAGDVLYNRVEKLALPQETSWQTKASLPFGRVFGDAVIYGDYLYYIGGTSDAGGKTETTTLWRYDIAANTWSTSLAQIPVSLAYMSAAVLNGKIYIPGDYDTAVTYIYDIATNSWDQIPFPEEMPSAAYYRCIAVGHEIWRIGGVAGNAAIDTVWALDTFSNIWYRFPVPINVARINHSAGSLGLRVGVAGGVEFPGFKTVTLTEYLDLADSDKDLLWDQLEKASCPNPLDADTDDDGIPDGVEDANHNGIIDVGETDFCVADTDLDGIQDGTERGYTTVQIGPDTDPALFKPDADPSTTTDPLKTDTDGDGLSDGSEDANRNGRIDPGETDPNTTSVYYVAPGANCNGKTPCYASVQSAINAAATPAIIKVSGANYNEFTSVDGNRSILLQGGCHPLDFATTSNMSTLRSIELRNAEITIRNIVIQGTAP